MTDELNNQPSPNNNFKVTGDISGSTLVIDPETGFLTNPPDDERTKQITPGKKGNVFGPLSVFPSEKKVIFLNFLKDLFPNYSEVCKIVGIARQTFKNHYSIDKAFRLRVDEIINDHVDQVESVRFRVAKGEKGVLDRMALLNAFRSETYNPAIKVDVSHTMTREESDKRYANLRNVVDAQVVERVKEIKREQKRIQ